jgi:tight adherence protein C
VPVCTFLAIALGVWGLLTALAQRRTNQAERIERLLRGAAARADLPSPLMRKQDHLRNLVERAAPALAKPLQGKEEEISQLRMKLLHAGYRGEQAVQVYLSLKFVLLLVALAVVVPLAYARHGLTMRAMWEVGGAAGIAFYAPAIVLKFLTKKRQEGIFLGLPDALDLMVVCVEAGLGLDSAMRRVASELATSCPCLCEEFAIANFQLQMGRPRREVLHDLGRRTGVSDVRSLAAILIQAERFGSSIATALRVQSDSMRIRRRQLAEERAAKTAVQLIFPLVLFIFPGIFVVLVGPAAITMVREMFPAMQGRH